MTSSKSFRGAMLPSSLSVMRSNTDPDLSSSNYSSTSNSSSSAAVQQDPHQKSWHKSSTIDLSDLRDPGTISSGSRDAVRHHHYHNSTGASRHGKNNSSKGSVGEPVHPQSLQAKSPATRKKSKTWGSRLSSLLPSVMLPSTDSAPSIPKQPTTAPPPPPTSAPVSASRSSTPTPVPVVTPALTKSSTPTDQSPSSSTSSIIEPQAVRMTEDDENQLGIVAQFREPPHSPPPSPPMKLAPESEQLDTANLTSDNNPQIVVPVPPSPQSSPVNYDMSPTLGPVDNANEPTKLTKLRKENPSIRQRSSSLQQRAGEFTGHKSRTSSPAPEPRGRRGSNGQPQSGRDSQSNSRVPSMTLNSRPTSGEVSQSPSRGRLRRSWLPGGRSRSNSVDVSGQPSASAWVLADDTKAEYNASYLKNAEKVPELWNESGNVLIFLHSRASGRGPSFKVQEFTVSSSYIFNDLIQSELESPTGRSRARSFGGRDSLSADDANRTSPPASPPIPDTGELRLYIPSAPSASTDKLAAPGPGSQTEFDRLIAIRNLFAFLTGQPLVATKARPTNFHAFLQIANLLEEFGFMGYDGTTFGDAVDLSFSFYVDQMSLADCRHSREKTLEALILGERMRSLELYNEAFAHAAGKYSAIMDLRLPLFEQVSTQTRQALEKAHFDLVNRQHNCNIYLEQFEFPAFFAGIANSTSVPELRHVRFKVWRNAFNRMRSFVLSYYKSSLGNWPPKASSKKNPFSESGLNRLVLKMLYADMCALYDLLVDRTNRTSRIMDEVPTISADPDKMTLSALRNILSEYDRSKPPVLPPIPYDTPQIPTAVSILETYNTLPLKKQQKFDKNVKEHEFMLVLNKAYNYDTNLIKLPFLDAFKDFELREARGKPSQDWADQRYGYWLFLYAVIQSLPVLVVDAPGMTYTEGVEYFLCQPPMGNPPWFGDRQVKKMWYEVAGGGGLVELSTDAVLFSVEATYHRSHCWLAAQQWETNPNESLPPLEPALSPLEPPRNLFPGEDDFSSPPPPMAGYHTPSPPLGGPQVALRPRTNSPAGNRASQAWRSSVALGLEPVPLAPPSAYGERSSSLGGRPMSSAFMGGFRSQSVGNLPAMVNPDSRPGTSSGTASGGGATFDDILGNETKKTKKKSRFF
ncbi:hypothetical protein BGZ63DRAFT_348405 [Mariannaea sp. PMI_226]|nr:hypothetical protein BGZ63DRAFT_348405 [Mariannaea sp. PMI_226]